jgi:hypothetical protein
MPNWCSNNVIITGAGDTVERVKAAIRDTTSDDSDTQVFALSRFLPCPQELLDAGSGFRDGAEYPSVEDKARFKATYGAPDWYDWCINNWGTKWDASSASVVEDTPGRYSVFFDTAWGPALPALDTLAAQFPEVTIVCSYDEPGCDFAGEVHWEDGARTVDIETPSLANAQYAAEEFLDELAEAAAIAGELADA